MTCFVERLQQKLTELLRDLGARPLSLFCLLLAANAVALPYRNFVHDANLYGVQVLNRVYPGRFADDLYFQYGSQDKYSVFSMVAAPLVARLGLPVGFFVLYLASNTLLLLALQRFVRALIKDPLVSTLALLFLAVTEIPFGGLRIFHVNEPFLTPRIIANALVLFALERLLAGRLWQAWSFVLLALPLHPLMAFPGILIVASSLILTRWQSKKLLAMLSLAALAASALLLNQPLASRWLGLMDDAWRDNVHCVNPYNFPFDWTANDWLRIILSFVVVLTATHILLENGAVRRLLLTMSAVAAVGLAGGIVACFLPYALPLQGQPYRCLWPLELALYPLGFLTAHRLWATRHLMARLAALGLLAYLNDTAWDSPITLLLLSSAGLFGIIVWRGMSVQPRVRDWPVRAAVFALGLALPLWTAIKLGQIVVLRRQLAALLHPIEVLELMTALVDPLCWLTLMMLASGLLLRFGGAGWKFAVGCLSICLASFLIYFVLPNTQFYLERYASHERDERFVAEYLAKYPASGAAPTVYWPVGKIAYLWLDLLVPSYFHTHQVVGNLFSSGNAAEGRRRAQLTRAFELDYLRRHRLFYSSRQFRQLLALYEAEESEPPPGRDDLLRLCQEKRLDFAVLPQEFAGLYTTTNGKLFIYDCRAIRAKWHQVPARGIASLPQYSSMPSNQ